MLPWCQGQHINSIQLFVSPRVWWSLEPRRSVKTRSIDTTEKAISLISPSDPYQFLTEQSWRSHSFPTLFHCSPSTLFCSTTLKPRWLTFGTCNRQTTYQQFLCKWRKNWSKQQKSMQSWWESTNSTQTIPKVRIKPSSWSSKVTAPAM